MFICGIETIQEHVDIYKSHEPVSYTHLVQTMRKEADFEVTDHIVLSMEGNEKLKAITEKNEDSVKKDVLAEAVAFGSTDGYVKEWNINGETVTLGVKKA